MITQEEALEKFIYDGEKGLLFWRNTKGEKGRIIGTTASSGDLVLCYKKKTLKVHRVMYLMRYGKLPDVVTHKNFNKIDNRISNLIGLTFDESFKRRKLSSRNKTGVSGVNLRKDGTWKVTIGTKSLGYFKDFDEAKAVRLTAEKAAGYVINKEGYK